MTVDPGEAVAFFAIAAIILGSALASVLARRTFHSVMFLGLTLVSVAAMFILLGSPILGVLQILVYVGGILTLFIFAVMFVAGDETETVDVPDAPAGKATKATFGLLLAIALGVYLTLLFGHGLFGVLAAKVVGGTPVVFLLLALAFGLLAWALAKANWTQRVAITATLGLAPLLLAAVGTAVPWQGASLQQGPGTEADISTLSDLLFGQYVLPLEILGVLLTAAMIGALVIARPLGQASDDSHYVKPDQATLDAALAVSDPANHGLVTGTYNSSPTGTGLTAAPAAASTGTAPAVATSEGGAA